MCWHKWPRLCLRFRDSRTLLRMYGFVPVFYVAYVILLSMNDLFAWFYFLVRDLFDLFVSYQVEERVGGCILLCEDIVCFVLSTSIRIIWYFSCVCPIMDSIYGYCTLGFLLSQEVHYIWRYILTHLKRSGVFSFIKCLTYLCGRYGWEHKCLEAFCWKTQRKEATWKI